MSIPYAQPRDWTEPGAHPVVPGVHRIPIGLPFEGPAAVNCYVLEGPHGLVLIDPGWATSRTQATVDQGLRQLGYRLADVAVCVATHHHWDHYTQAYRWRTTLGTALYTGYGERHSIGEFGLERSRFPHHIDLLVRCGAPDLARQVANQAFAEYERSVPYGPPDGWLHPGERIPVDGGELEVVGAPGHTRGHITLRHTARDVLFSGDHILPRITPSLGFEWAPEPQPLRSFLESLTAALAVPDTVLLPAHGPVLDSTHARVRELLQHHEERLELVCRQIRRGGGTAYDVARAVPWTRHECALDELELDHQMLAVTETGAHLEVLRLRGAVDVRVEDAVRRYIPG
ncbi:Glyoxylase, beta-lactamase superfamily II [Haloechinothrix alba]|uniref:Glyoxylase, beta-lactamase superfamily II n=1 Tax=Haloechinothrix alba TaxID=664784 RepID=A0A238ZGU9_9PSEU|nr:MBL fold metallo-hydrolase [Haloechinothrix alba]SNR82695.1 Glyoxylase, beta-lactamase superfamily II [Haloechinothrix alba]